MSEQKRTHSVTVYTTPLNAVKYDLGIFILLILPVWALVERLVLDVDHQFLYLLAYSALAALWLIVRIQRAMARSTVLNGDNNGA
ncbi:MAG: hypothetical protein OEX12_00515 [Gammaproteobacteria bacterium]|nr:hypothetical protein [Gammaproteobacteria bacterium]